MVLLLCIVGLAVGSFLNVIIVRLETDDTLFLSRSRCPLCKHALAARDLVPVLSFVFLAGRCRFCHKPISWQYPLVEFSAGLLFAGVGLLFFNPFDIVFWCFFAASFVVIIVYDLRYQLIPDAITLPLVVAALIYRLLTPQTLQPFIITGIITGGFILALVVITRERAMGWGDVPIAFLQGLLLGYPWGLAALGLSFILGAMIGLALIARKKATLKTAVPFAPFLIAGILLVTLYVKVL